MLSSFCILAPSQESCKERDANVEPCEDTMKSHKVLTQQFMWNLPKIWCSSSVPMEGKPTGNDNPARLSLNVFSLCFVSSKLCQIRNERSSTQKLYPLYELISFLLALLSSFQELSRRLLGCSEKEITCKKHYNIASFLQ